MRVQSSAQPLVALVVVIALGLAPAAVITAIMALVLTVAPQLALAGKLALYDAAVLANIAVWLAFSPPYLVGWVQCWDPQARARTGVPGLLVLACVMWFCNMFVYAATGSLVAALLRS